jgi:peptidyl-tRNA hydrolase, PTH1 family
MKLVVGLGNPGRAYERTRHNAGFAVMDELARRAGVSFRKNIRTPAATADAELGGQAVRLVKPQSFMNDSGRPVAALMRRKGLTPEGVIVVVDDIDLPCGRLRIRAAGGAGGHNGLKSLLAHLGADTFARVRIGVGRPAGAGDEVVDHVLSRFAPDERAAMEEAVARAADAVECMLQEGTDRAMNRFNG